MTSLKGTGSHWTLAGILVAASPFPLPLTPPSVSLALTLSVLLSRLLTLILLLTLPLSLTLVQRTLSSSDLVPLVLLSEGNLGMKHV